MSSLHIHEHTDFTPPRSLSLHHSSHLPPCWVSTQETRDFTQSWEMIQLHTQKEKRKNPTVMVKRQSQSVTERHGSVLKVIYSGSKVLNRQHFWQAQLLEESLNYFMLKCIITIAAVNISPEWFHFHKCSSTYECGRIQLISLNLLKLRTKTKDVERFNDRFIAGWRLDGAAVDDTVSTPQM